MNHEPRRVLTRHLASFVSMGSLLVACSSGSDANDPPGPGGSGGSAGAATGGSAGFAGSSTGGSAGTAGSSTGGGGTSGGGTTASGGSAGGDVPTFDMSWTFDDDLDGFALSNGEPAAIDTGSTATHDSANGSPDPGTAALSIPFSGIDEKISFSIILDAPTDLTGKTVEVRVRLESGLSSDPSNPGGAQAFVKSEGWIYASNEWTNLDTVGNWTTLTLNVDNPAGFIDTSGDPYDPTRIVEIGVEIKTGSLGDMYEPGVVLVDTVGYL